jgi:4-diphosphocytidyl-2-C-methyl-D-erythritol kinase
MPNWKNIFRQKSTGRWQMSKPVSLRAPAKINLNLNMTGRRADSYHLLDSVAIFAELADHITISLASTDSVTMTGSMTGNINPADTSLHKARDAFRLKTGWNQPVSIRMEKHIPVAAGLGGGSADAAAVLRGMAMLSEIQMNTRDMMEIALGIGADVPALMHSWQTSALRMQGIGEQLTPLHLSHDLGILPGILLANPGVAVSTAAVFDAMRQANPDMDMDMEMADHASALPDDPLDLTAQIARGNDMTAAAISLAPAIETLLVALHQSVTEYQGYGAAMSGSGATCFALFPTIQQAEKAGKLLKSVWKDDPIWCWTGEIMKPEAP